jgi:hypothetical protein
MKHKLIALISLVLLFLAPASLLAGQASAVDIFTHTCGSGANFSSTGVCKSVKQQQTSGSSPIITVIRDVIDVISFLIGAASIIGILISSIRLISASGDPQAIATARSGLAYSLVGIAIATLAQVIVVFVLDNVS